MPVTAELLIKEIRSGHFRPVYFLHGEEPYYIDLIAEELEKRVVPVEQKGFGQFVLYGKDTDVTTVLHHARSFPFMAERQLVMVKEAQKLGGIDQKEPQNHLGDYAANPLRSTVLVLCYHGNADERKAFVKSFDKNGALLSSKKMYDNKLPEWVAAYCHERQVKISPKAIQMLVDNIGNDLKRLHNEIVKVLVNLKEGEGIDAGTVERYIGISKEYNVFELQKALIQRDVMKANRIAFHFAASPKENPLLPMLIILYMFFSKLLLAHAAADKSEKGLAAALSVNAFFVKDYLQGMRNYPYGKVAVIIGLLRETDARLKGVEGGTANEGELLKELVFKILH